MVDQQYINGYVAALKNIEEYTYIRKKQIKEDYYTEDFQTNCLYKDLTSELDKLDNYIGQVKDDYKKLIKELNEKSNSKN